MKDMKNNDTLKAIEFNNAPELFVKALHTYVNYETLEKEAEKNGAVMKESKEHYEYIVLRDLKKLFENKSKSEIAHKVLPLFED